MVESSGGPPDLAPAPSSAAEVFDDGRLPVVERYGALLASEATLRGLIGPREVPRLWERHLINCGLLARLIGPGATMADVGSGAGLPGLVVAIARPDLSVTLIEPLLRRTTFLEEVVDTLALGNVEVVRARAESLAGSRQFDVVTSRALAPMTRLVQWSMPLVGPSGHLLAMKGSQVADELSAAGSLLASLGCTSPEVVELAASGVEPTHVVRVAWRHPSQVALVPARRPVASAEHRPRSAPESRG